MDEIQYTFDTMKTPLTATKMCLQKKFIFKSKPLGIYNFKERKDISDALQ